jgi:predicted GNAT family acetyltransferase
MRAIRHDSAASFLRRAEPFLLRAEAENNLLLGIATALARTAPLGRRAYFVTVESEEVVGCALRTPPHKLALTRIDDEPALRVLADDVFQLDPDLPMVMGPEPSIASFASHWRARSGANPSPMMRQRIYESRSVRLPAELVPGALRQATQGDLPLLVPWIADFLTTMSEPRDPAEFAHERLATGSLFLWDNGGAVSMASFTGKTPNGVRVSGVYTPPVFRRQGYATACVAALTQRLFDAGNKYCCLYTDLANPTSNSIYQRIGYRPVCDVVDYALAG